MGMFHSSSGKFGYDLYEFQKYEGVCGKGPTSSSRSLISDAEHLAIVRRESELRCSEEYQNEYAKEDSNEWRLKVTLQLQRQALKEFGFVGDDALQVLHSSRATMTHQGDSEHKKLYKEAAIYAKYDRSDYGISLNYQSFVPIPVVTLDNTPLTLQHFVDESTKQNKMLLVISGSYS